MDDTNDIIEIIDGTEGDEILPESAASIELTDLGTKIMSEVCFAQNRILMLPVDEREPAIENLKEELCAVLDKIKAI
jgi:hypothetical protein